MFFLIARRGPHMTNSLKVFCCILFVKINRISCIPSQDILGLIWWMSTIFSHVFVLVCLSLYSRIFVLSTDFFFNLLSPFLNCNVLSLLSNQNEWSLFNQRVYKSASGVSQTRILFSYNMLIFLSVIASAYTGQSLIGIGKGSS